MEGFDNKKFWTLKVTMGENWHSFKGFKPVGIFKSIGHNDFKGKINHVQ